MRTSPTEKEATCRWTLVDVPFVLGVDYQEVACQPVLKKRRIVGKVATAKGTLQRAEIDEAVFEVTVTVPVLTNFRPLNAGAELVIFKPKADKRAKEPSAITFATLSQKIRAVRASAAAKSSGRAAATATF